MTAWCTFFNAFAFQLFYVLFQIPFRTDVATTWVLVSSMVLCICYVYTLNRIQSRWIDFTFLALLNANVFNWIESQVRLRQISLLAALNEAPTRTFIPVVCFLIGGNRIGSFFCGVSFFYYFLAGRLPLDAIPSFFCATDLVTVLSLIFFHNQHNERVYDLLYQKHLAEQAASQAKAKFMEKMSHDLRTPLNGLMGFLGEFTKKNPNCPLRELTEELNVVLMCATSLRTLIQDLLDVSLMEFGNIQLVSKVFNAPTCFNTLATLFKKQAVEKKLNLSLSLEQNFPPYLKGDWSRIQQLLTNLVNNSIKFTPAMGSVEISLRHTETVNQKIRVDFRVQDTGIGIPSSDINKIFKSFFQCRKGDADQGSGLGLFICEQLLKAMGGEIRVCSKEGAGTTFWGYFLVERGTPEPSQSEESINLAGLRVLVVEDNHINLKLLTRMLESLGISFLTASDGFEAVEQYEKCSTQLDGILMDIHMPKMDGIQATQKIRSLKRGYIPIIAVTAGVTQSETEALFQSGFDAYLPKPISQDRLKLELAKWRNR